MDSTHGFLSTVIERVRMWLDEPDLNAKYSDRYLVLHVIPPAMVDVLARIAMTADDIIVLRHTLNLVDHQEFYQLPPNIGEVHRLATLDANGNVLSEWMPVNRFHPRGPGWEIQGNTLCWRPFPLGAQEVDLWYVPTGDVQLHYAVDGALEDDLTTFTLPIAGPLLGSFDRRPNAYAGSILRVLPPAPHPIEERIIESYDVAARTITVRLPFTHTPAGIFPYEIAPCGSEPLYEAISLRSAMKLAVPRGISRSKKEDLLLEYKSAIKTIIDNKSNLQMRIGKSFAKDTVDNMNGQIGFLG